MVQTQPNHAALTRNSKQSFMPETSREADDEASNAQLEETEYRR